MATTYDGNYLRWHCSPSGAANLVMGGAAVAALLNLVRHYRDAILAWAGAGVAAPAATVTPSRARAASPAKKRPGEGGTEQLLPPGGIDSAEVSLDPNPNPNPSPNPNTAGWEVTTRHASRTRMDSPCPSPHTNLTHIEPETEAETELYQPPTKPNSTKPNPNPQP